MAGYCLYGIYSAMSNAASIIRAPVVVLYSRWSYKSVHIEIVHSLPYWGQVCCFVIKLV